MRKIHTIYDLTQYSLIFVKKKLFEKHTVLFAWLPNQIISQSWTKRCILSPHYHDYDVKRRKVLSSEIARQSHVILKILFLFFNGLSF